MIARSIVVSVAILFLAACAAEPRPQPRWSKPGSGSEELSAARAECEKRAMAPDLGVDRDRVQADARGNIFLRCMREKGWKQVPGDASE